MSEQSNHIFAGMEVPRRLVELEIPAISAWIKEGAWAPDGRSRVVCIELLESEDTFLVGLSRMPSPDIVEILTIPACMVIAHYEPVVCQAVQASKPPAVAPAYQSKQKKRH